MTAIELKNLFRTVLVARRTITQEYTALDAIVDFIIQASNAGIPAWEDDITFNTDGSGSGAFSTHTDEDNHLRFWKTKVDDNIDHEPPTDPDITEDDFWEEVSPSDGSAIKEYTPGVYPAGLQIVYFDVTGAGKQPALYLLANPTRPFTSTDFFAELADGDWIQLGSFNYENLNTAGPDIDVDIEHQTKCAYKGSAAIGGIRTWNFLNAENLREATIRFTLSAAAVQSFPDVKCSDGGWDSGAKEWTPYAPGSYEAIATSDGVDIYLKIFGPYN